MTLERRVVLITGGAVRLGKAITLALAREGYHVAISYNRSSDAARFTVQAAESLGVRALAIRADLSRERQVEALVSKVLKAFGRIHILVNNAGIFSPTPFLETTARQWDQFMTVNLRGPFLCSQRVARHMVAAGGGRIINITDVGGLRAWPHYVPYNVSKAGLIMLTKGMAVALAPLIQVNGVAPGVVLLPEDYPEEMRRKIRRGIPMGREGTPEDVAEAVVFFAKAPRYITGQTLFVDGGATAR